MVLEERRKQKDKIQTYGIMIIPITEALKDASILLGLKEMSRQDIKDVYDNIKGKVDVKFRDVQRKDSRRLVKQLVDTKLNQLKSIVKAEKKRKREDEEEEKQDAKAKEIGKKIKKEAKKDKGKLRQLIKAIHSADPVKDKYIVANVEFYDGADKHFTITPFNKEKIIEHLRDLSKGKQVQGEVYFSDAVGDYFIPGKRVKSFKLVSKKAFDIEEKAKYEKNSKKRINKKARGGLLPPRPPNRERAC